MPPQHDEPGEVVALVELDAALAAAGAALCVKNTALEALLEELNCLRRENELLSAAATERGGEHVPGLVRALTAAEAELLTVSAQLSDEMALRTSLEDELAETAAAAQELWASVQAVYSEAADSRSHSPDEEEASDVEAWGTPPGAASPLLSSPPAQLAPVSLAQAVVAAAGTAPAGDAQMHPWSPLENKLQRLSNKLTGLVSWLDAREAASPASTPRSGTRSPLRLGAASASAGLGSPIERSPGSASSGKGPAARVSPPVAKALGGQLAATAAAGPGRRSNSPAAKASPAHTSGAKLGASADALPGRDRDSSSRSPGPAMAVGQ